MDIPNINITIPDIDDKTFVIIAVTIIACWATYQLKYDYNSITLVVSNAFSGLFGIAVGRSIVKKV